MKKALSIAILAMAACAFLGAQQSDLDAELEARARRIKAQTIAAGRQPAASLDRSFASTLPARVKPQSQPEPQVSSRLDSLLALYALSALPHHRPIYQLSSLSFPLFDARLLYDEELYFLRHEMEREMYWEREKIKSDAEEAARQLRSLIDELKREKR